MTVAPRHLALGLAGVAMAAILAAVFAKTSHSDAQGLSQEAPAYLPPVERWKETRGASTIAALSAKTVDVLDAVDVRQDAVAGTWGFYGRSMITSSATWGRLQFPVEPPEEYDLTVTATRARGSGALRLGLVLGGFQGMIEIDATDKPTTSLLLADGYEPGANETSRVGKLLRWNLRSTMVCAVRKRGVTLDVDGKKIIDWKGDRREWIVPSGWLVPRKGTLFVGSDETAFKIDEVLLTPVSGSPTRIR